MKIRLLFQKDKATWKVWLEIRLSCLCINTKVAELVGIGIVSTPEGWVGWWAVEYPSREHNLLPPCSKGELWQWFISC